VKAQQQMHKRNENAEINNNGLGALTFLKKMKPQNGKIEIFHQTATEQQQKEPGRL
jgi:hypothetical protein